MVREVSALTVHLQAVSQEDVEHLFSLLLAWDNLINSVGSRRRTQSEFADPMVYIIKFQPQSWKCQSLKTKPIQNVIAPDKMAPSSDLWLEYLHCIDSYQWMSFYREAELHLFGESNQSEQNCLGIVNGLHYIFWLKLVLSTIA